MAPQTVACADAGRCAASSACAPAREPCIGLGDGHAVTLALCSELETVVAMLPEPLGRLACLRVANELLPHLRDAHRMEEALFAAVDRTAGEQFDARTIVRLKAEHVESEWAAQALTATLLAVGHGALIADRSALEAEVAAFVGALRSHVAGERNGIFGASDPLSHLTRGTDAPERT